jgi:YHS domain-containing protein
MMKPILLPVVIAALGVGGYALSSRAESAPSTAPSTQPTAAAPVNKFCAIDRDNPIDPQVTTTYEGKVIGFCCEDCIPKFKQDPAKAMKDLK